MPPTASKRTTFLIRCSQDELDSWRQASMGGQNLSSWLRRLANEEVARVTAERSEREEKKTQRQRLLKSAFPTKTKGGCEHSVKAGAYCYLCQRKIW